MIKYIFYYLINLNINYKSEYLINELLKKFITEIKLEELTEDKTLQGFAGGPTNLQLINFKNIILEIKKEDKIKNQKVIDEILTILNNKKISDYLKYINYSTISYKFQYNQNLKKITNADILIGIKIVLNKNFKEIYIDKNILHIKFNKSNIVVDDDFKKIENEINKYEKDGYKIGKKNKIFLFVKSLFIINIIGFIILGIYKIFVKK